MTLDDQDVEAIAVRVAEILKNALPSAYQFLNAKELAKELKVSLDYVYAHAVELGVMRLGDGPKARLRFDLDTAKSAMKARIQRGRRTRGRRF
jgi:hypothetical protein